MEEDGKNQLDKSSFANGGRKLVSLTLVRYMQKTRLGHAMRGESLMRGVVEGRMDRKWANGRKRVRTVDMI